MSNRDFIICKLNKVILNDNFLAYFIEKLKNIKYFSVNEHFDIVFHSFIFYTAMMQLYANKIDFIEFRILELGLIEDVHSDSVYKRCLQ